MIKYCKGEKENLSIGFCEKRMDCNKVKIIINDIYFGQEYMFNNNYDLYIIVMSVGRLGQQFLQ